jgi:aminoglycoside phosphotransferase (APT) family kinase protein
MNMTRPTTPLIYGIASAALGGEVVVEPVLDGVSTYVYRLRRGAEVFYLRVLPEEGATYAPEVAAHAILRRQGVHVPEVVFWDDDNQVVGRSVMITAEVKGSATGRSDVGADLPYILRAAGRDVALLNQVPVDGFGWVRHDVRGDDRLRGEVPTEREFLLADLDRSLSALQGTAVGSRQREKIGDIVRAMSPVLDAMQAHLAHGDLDLTHIYYQDGQYTGIIDLGEIRGTGPYYDLGHVRFHDGELLTTMALPYLLDGYQEIRPLPPDADHRIALASLLIGVHFFARTHTRLAKVHYFHAVTSIARDVALFMA